MERKHLAQFKSLLPILALILTTACTRDAAKDAKISIQLPAASSALNVSQSVNAFSTKWLLNDPTASSQLNCYAIAIEPMSASTAPANSCFKQNGDIVARPAVIHGGFAAGTTQEIEVASGSERKIYLIGFQTDDIAKCKDVNASIYGLDPAHFSSPFILDSVTKDFVPGATVEVAMTVPATIPAAGKFEECSPYQFGKQASGTPMTISSISPTSGSSLGGQTLTITGSGFTSGIAVDIGGASCTAVVIVSATTITCTTGSHAAGLNAVTLTRSLEQVSLASSYTYNSLPGISIANASFAENAGTAAVTVSLDATAASNVTVDYAVTGGTASGGGADYTLAAGTVTILSGASSGSFSVSVVNDTADEPDETIMVTLSNATNSTILTATAIYTITDDDLSPAVLTATPASYNFGNVASGGLASTSFTITNSGESVASGMTGSGLAAPFSFMGGSYPGTGGTCAASLAGSGATCMVTVAYNPTTIAAHSDALDLAYNDGYGTQTLSLSLNGTGTAPASLSISDSGFNYGTLTVGNSMDKSYTITNTGAVSATAMTAAALSAGYSFKGGAYPGTGGDCGATLGASTNCFIVVTFQPTVPSTQNTAITINYNDGAVAQSVTNNVTGMGQAPASISITNGPVYDFGTQANGSSTAYSFTIQNNGSSTASAMTYSVAGAPYTVSTGSCTASLNAGSSCTLSVTFAPIAIGSFNDMLTIAYNDGAIAQNATRNVTGTGAAPALLSISNPGFVFPTLGSGQASDQTFTLDNSGGVTATSINGGGLAAPLTYKDGSWPGTGGSCGATLAPAANCTFVVTSGPSTTSTINDTIEITYNDGASAQMATNAITASFDTTPPAYITFASGAPPTTNMDVIPIDIVFSEPPLSFTASSLFSTTGTILGVTGTGTTYKALFAPNATNSNVELVIPGNSVQDMFGNWQSAASATLTWNFTMPAGNSSVTGLPSAPAPARHPAAVWLGATWFVWGGADGGGPLAGGAIYDPSANAWTAIPTTGQPSPRDRAVAAFNGKQVLIWGGNSGAPVNDGSLYDKTSNTWSAVATSGAPSARHSASIVTHGNSFYIWGGNSGSTALNSGAVYNSAANSWTVLPTTGAPSGRYHHAAVAAGSQMIVWGGNDGIGGILNSGARLDMGTSTWLSMSTTGQPSPREDFSYVWTGSKLIVWGGSGPGATLLGDGAIYDPQTDSWSAIANTGDTPSPRAFAQAVWTGTQMIISGGITAYGHTPEHFALDPVNGNWTRLRASISEPRAHHVAAWTGTQMLEFGGEGPNMTFLNSGNVLDPMFNGMRVKELVMGDTHTCALFEAGKLKCWGGNAYGALGTGSTLSLGDGAGEMGSALPFVDLGTGKSVLKLAAGNGFNCAILNDHSVKCWGANSAGQLGLGDLNSRGDGPGEMGDSLSTVNLSGQRALDIAAGSSHACAVTEDGLVRCWGAGTGGQLGNGAAADSSTPVSVSGISPGAVQVVAGSQHTCVRTFDGVSCWGTNTSGQVGDGTTTTRTAPVSISSFSLSAVRHLTARAGATCAALPGQWQCWGLNTSGSLGDGSTINRLSPVNVTAGGSSMLRLSQGGNHACAMDSGGIRCWGNNTYGQLGLDNTTASTSPGITIAGFPSGAAGVTTGLYASCAWYADGAVRCWGQGSSGRLGMGNINNYGSSGTYPMSALTGIQLF